MAAPTLLRAAPGRLREAFWGWRGVHYALILGLHREFFASNKAGHNDWWFFFHPWADALRLSILKYHEFPWWNPWSVSGQPLFADPQIKVLLPDTLFTLAFGAVLGLKLIVVFYFLVGYEGTRFLCFHLFGRSRFVEAVAIVPALLPTLALHLNEGHVPHLDFFLFPWLLALGLTWWRSTSRAIALGAVVGACLLGYLNYLILMGFTIVGLIVLVQIARRLTSLDVWLRAAIVACTALGIGLVRVVPSLMIVHGFPRADAHYPIVYSVQTALAAVAEPLLDRHADLKVSDLGPWEAASYVGVLALVLAYEGLRDGVKKHRWLYVGAAACFALAWNNRDVEFPSYWLHSIFPWSTLQVITRWSAFACYFLLLGAVEGLLAIRRRGAGGRRLAAVLAVLAVGDLGFHIVHAYHGLFEAEAPPWVAASDPPRTLGGHQEHLWPNLRQNEVTGGAVCPLLGMGWHQPSRERFGEPSYRGEFHGNAPVNVESWSPNRIVLTGTPGDRVTLNINPSNYWLMNGERLFPDARAFEIAMPFQVTMPESGRMELLPRPPHLGAILATQLAFAAAAFLLARFARRRDAARA
jgi:hypothetical protein